MRSDERCAFCEKARGEVRKMVHGTKAAICNECIDLCWDVLSEPSESRGGQAIAQDRAMAVARRKYTDAFAGVGVGADQLESFMADAVRIAREPPMRALRTVRFWLSHEGQMGAQERIARVQSVIDEALADEPAPVIMSRVDEQTDVLLGPPCPSCGALANVRTEEAGGTVCVQCGHELDPDE